MKHLLNPENGTFILRVALGIVLLAHSAYLKLMIFTLTGTAKSFASMGLPEVLAYVVFITEVIAGIALILGVYSRFFSALVIPILIGATWAHFGNGWLFTNDGGGWEFPMFLSVAALVQCMLGDGKYSIMNFRSQPLKQASAR